MLKKKGIITTIFLVVSTLLLIAGCGERQDINVKVSNIEINRNLDLEIKEDSKKDLKRYIDYEAEVACYMRREKMVCIKPEISFKNTKDFTVFVNTNYYNSDTYIKRYFDKELNVLCYERVSVDYNSFSCVIPKKDFILNDEKYWKIINDSFTKDKK